MNEPWRGWSPPPPPRRPARRLLVVLTVVAVVAIGWTQRPQESETSGRLDVFSRTVEDVDYPPPPTVPEIAEIGGMVWCAEQGKFGAGYSWMAKPGDRVGCPPGYDVSFDDDPYQCRWEREKFPGIAPSDECEDFPG